MVKHRQTNVTKRLAVIDIGTANTKIMIAEKTVEKQIAILHRDQQRTHIHDGKSSAPSGTLTVEQVLKQYMAALDHYGVESYRVLGTESLRNTQGPEDLSASIAALTNKEVEVLSQEQEATLFFEAVSAYMPGEMAVVDVGGGSVQIILGSEEGIKQSYLLKTGTVT